ncbi:MAG TPA: glycosyltransferase [Cyanobacteria bacterium UBA8803]|nr:glycosyltransferase [Cyanobacteria bacterium UBA9273]HBL61705.1 glycosyltransferase [Cyanobacteria bacterium UBA8803]
MVYSHDTFGLGNIRRMLAICKYLLDSLPGLSILLVSGSPVVHSFRMPQGLDYIKLPCLGRNESGDLSAKYLGTETDAALKLRSDLIQVAAVNFKPDLLLVDKKPYALQGELKSTLDYLKTDLPDTKVVLLLRDILDSPETTIAEWQKYQYYRGIELFYDQVWVVGMAEVFDVIQEYQFPDSIARKLKFCGYIRRELGQKPRSILRQELQIQPDEQLVLVTPGGGGDGYRLIETYLSGLVHLPREGKIKSLIICGPEMPLCQRQVLYQAAESYPQVEICEFTDDLISYMDAADTVVSMAGYNTVCEIISLSKRAVVVPRIQPVQEQWIRAERMEKFGLLKAIHPDFLTPQTLMDAVLEQLNSDRNHLPLVSCLNLDALPQIIRHLYALLGNDTQFVTDGYRYPISVQSRYLAQAKPKLSIC